MIVKRIVSSIRSRAGFGVDSPLGARRPLFPNSGVTMLRSIRSTAFLGTLLLTGAAMAQTTPASTTGADKAAEGSAPSAAADTAAPDAKEGDKAAAAVPAPPPPPPVDEEDVAAETPKAQKKRTVGSAGLDTQATTIGGAGDVGDSTSEKDWGFKFKGFFRAPMRVGIDGSGSLTPGKMQYHSIPVTPDGNYTRWMYTNISPGPWAELMFQYGNQQVMMTTSIASYNITSGGWRELQDQLGIDRAFLTLKFPEALGNLGGMAWDVGIFSNRYGGMGKYDAGEYETYVIGRTRLAGATATADLELSDDFKLILEGGAGAKTDQQYQRYTCTGSPAADASCAATYDYPSWQPYPGDQIQQGTNLLAHLHVGAVFSDILTAQLHYINSFVRDARWNVGTSGGANVGGQAVPVANVKDGQVPGEGSIQIFGADAKLDGGWMGDGYLGVSYLKANNPLVINDSIEVLHSQGGWQLAHNYFANSTKGNILTVAGQYTFSVAAFMMRPRPFWGQAADITIRPFFMFNKVSGTNGGLNDVKKLKYGLDGVYSFAPMMAVGLRLDSVNPNMDDSTQSFYVFSPRLIFRSEFVTHEAVVLQYSYYAYGSSYTDPSKSGDLMPWPFGTYGTNNISASGYNMQPDKHVVTLYANMWW
jgi:hypothetical protein